MVNYLITRKGNQNACNNLGPLTIVEAKNKTEALKIAETDPTYNNQYLVAIPESKASVRDWNTASALDALRDTHRRDCEHQFTDYGYQDLCVFCGLQMEVS